MIKWHVSGPGEVYQGYKADMADRLMGSGEYLIIDLPPEDVVEEHDWVWPTWPVVRDKTERQPQARRYTAH